MEKNNLQYFIMFSEPKYNKKLEKSKVLIGNWYEEGFQKSKDVLRKKYQSDDLNFSLGKDRATFIRSSEGVTAFMADDHDFPNKSMSNIQSLPDLSYHYETDNKISSAPMETTLRHAQESALKEKTKPPVSKKQRILEEALLKEAIKQAEYEKELRNRNDIKLESTYSVNNVYMEELLNSSKQLKAQSYQNGESYETDEPITFYTDSLQSENGENTTIYHSKTTGVSRFGKNAGFSCPISEYNRGVTQEE